MGWVKFAPLDVGSLDGVPDFCLSLSQDRIYLWLDIIAICKINLKFLNMS
uniref:Uncharacterized protein n=1 Tax=Desertifilum tharense IPPAS B-1220 TaxID=1781255 RepID=A0ACD5GQ49_9CYAN